MHYNYFRDYDPLLGRYVQSDPIGLRAGLSTYAYVGGNPLWQIDSLGLMGGGAGSSRTPQDVSVFGCVVGCLSSTVNRIGGPQVSLEPTIGGGIEICDRKPEPKSCDIPKRKRGCGLYDPNCDNTFQPGDVPLRGPIGLFVGASIKRDMRVCVRFGFFGSLPFVPSFELGDLEET